MMQQERSVKIVANWVLLGVAMLLIQVVIGGITRLTGSGLSITEWKPIMGALPPMTEAAWQAAFAKYQTIAQYKYLNNHFTVEDFKFIFFWEWFHRQWARLIAVAFAIPFVYFLIKGYIKKWMVKPLLILFLLGGLQGAIGWIMVMSGLNDENLYVNHIRLAIHFVSAMVLICYALVFSQMLRTKTTDRVYDPGLKKFGIAIIAVLTIQLFYGAFMAGLKAAQAASTWPDINGMIIPDSMSRDSLFQTLFVNPVSIHFIHRTLAYILFIIVLVWWWKLRLQTTSTVLNKWKHWPLILVGVQVVLGIFSVLTSPKIIVGQFGIFEWMAQLHQIVGMLLLLAIVGTVYVLRQNPKAA
jgi:cytochrome c oxidase assembly protein subunit 15